MEEEEEEIRQMYDNYPKNTRIKTTSGPSINLFLLQNPSPIKFPTITLMEYRDMRVGVR